MSIALDLALFFRNSKTKLGLTLSARGLLFTLAFRVGSHTSTWISPALLAKECGISRQKIFIPLDKILATKLLKKKTNPKDKRKSHYSFCSEIKGYHQMDDDSKRKVHELLNDEFAQLEACNPQRMSPKSDLILGDMSPKGDYECHQKVTKFECANSDLDQSSCGLQELAQIPKVTMKATIEAKEQVLCANELAQETFEKFWFEYPRKKDKRRTEKIWIKQRLYEQATTIINDVVKRRTTDVQWKDVQYIPHPSTYLNGERWNDDITPSQTNGAKNHARTKTHHERVCERLGELYQEELNGTGSAAGNGRPEKEADYANDSKAVGYNPLW